MIKKHSPGFYSVILAFLAICPTILSSLGILFLFNNQEFLSFPDLQHQSLFFLVVCLTMALALTPTTVVAIVTGYFFSWTGLVLLVISYSCACVLGIKLGRILNSFGFNIEKAERINRVLTNLNNNQFAFVFFARLSPILPFAMTNVALSNLKIKWKEYILGSILGMFPRTFIFFYAGKNARDIWTFIHHPSLNGFYKLLPVVLIFISTIGILQIIKKQSPVLKN